MPPVDWINWLDSKFADVIWSLIPPVPSQFTNACGLVQDAFTGSEFAVFSHFIPFASIVGIAIIMQMVLVAFTIRIMRIVFSFMSGGGGA